jgi:hypothetical protein
MNPILCVSTIQAAGAFMLPKYLAFASGTRTAADALLITVETIGEAGRILQAGSFTRLQCLTQSGGFPRNFPNWRL